MVVVGGVGDLIRQLRKGKKLACEETHSSPTAKIVVVDSQDAQNRCQNTKVADTKSTQTTNPAAARVSNFNPRETNAPVEGCSDATKAVLESKSAKRRKRKRRATQHTRGKQTDSVQVEVAHTVDAHNKTTDVSQPCPTNMEKNYGLKCNTSNDIITDSPVLHVTKQPITNTPNTNVHGMGSTRTISEVTDPATTDEVPCNNSTRILPMDTDSTRTQLETSIQPSSALYAQSTSRNHETVNSQVMQVKDALATPCPTMISIQNSKPFASAYLARTSMKPNQNNFFKGVEYSPDGTCVLFATEDCELSICNSVTPTESSCDTASYCLTPDVTCTEGGCVYDYCWYPYMNSSNPATCCFLSTSKDHPIHLWDAYNGSLRATYTARNHMDELDPAIAVTFSSQARRIFAGFNRCWRVFDPARPGVAIEEHFTSHTRRSRDGQRGLLSCIASNPDLSGIVAIGSYSGTIALYSEGDPGTTLMQLDQTSGHMGGVTQVKFSPDGKYLYSGARKDNSIFCWDIRNTCSAVMELRRPVSTNQRIQFDISPSGTALITGTTENKALIYDLSTGRLEREIVHDSILQDAVNGVSFNPTVADGSSFALVTGTRHFADSCSDTDSESEDSTFTWTATLSHWSNQR